MKTANLVTPADVGKRVTFQFELPNGFLSEVVGVFERYDEGAETYFVRRKTGEVVACPRGECDSASWSKPRSRGHRSHERQSSPPRSSDAASAARTRTTAAT